MVESEHASTVCRVSRSEDEQGERGMNRCIGCGAELPERKPQQRGRDRQYCSSACNQRTRKARLIPFIESACEYCGEPIRHRVTAKNRRFCSRECTNKYHHKRATQTLDRCVICGASIEVRQGGYGNQPTKYCSEKCRNKKKSERLVECIQCGRKFMAAQRKTCSNECERMIRSKTATRNGKIRKCYSNPRECGRAAVVRRRRRIRERWVEPVTLRYLIERDGGRCQICGRKCGKTKGHHPLAPTIDHIIPLSLGGKHELKNCQLAHHKCNMMKSASPVGQQRLVG